MDRWILGRLQEVIRRVRDAYENYQFHQVYTTLYNFCTVDLSSQYLDVIKDRLYTSKATSRPRRSGQTAMCEVLDVMARLLAPILTFTAEEIWLALPSRAGKAESIHLTLFPEVDDAKLNPELAAKWKMLIAVKGEIARAIETARQNKVVGHSLDAAIMIALPDDIRPQLEANIEDLRAFLIVSALDVVDAGAIENGFQSADIPGLLVGVSRAKGAKCERCWNYSETVGESADHPTICSRCVSNL
jgi:isoleucyl-tRNA synthetase